MTPTPATQRQGLASRYHDGLNSVSGLVSNVSRSTNQDCPFRKCHKQTRRSYRVAIFE
jgi:hypothetical protein